MTDNTKDKVDKDDVIDKLTSKETKKPLSANQGRILAEGKQDKIGSVVQTSDGKAGMRSDGEGGNFWLKSKNGQHWEADAYDDNLRVYYGTGSPVFQFMKDGVFKIADVLITKTNKLLSSLSSSAFSTVVNNATTTVAGTVLDGRMGKTIWDNVLNLSNLYNSLNSA